MGGQVGECCIPKVTSPERNRVQQESITISSFTSTGVSS